MNRRLDSWKAIADYLGRDAATARRWEKTLGLPVHRVAGGAGRSVFAYTEEIDIWLAASPTGATPAVAANGTPAAVSDAPPVPLAVPLSVDVGPTRVRRSFAARQAAAAIAVVALLGTAWWATSSRAAPAPLRFTTDERRIVARGEGGREEWRYEFPPGTATVWPAFTTPARVISGGSEMVFVATSYRQQLLGGPIAGGELMAFDTAGRRQRSFSFDDEITVKGTTFSAPWVVTDYSVMGSGSNRQVAIAAHHYTWSPSVVTVLDADWRRQRTFVNDGWIETLLSVGPGRLVAGGFDQEHDGGLAVLLDTTTMQPKRKVILPRTEINLVTGSRFNRTVIEPVNAHLLARSIEMPDELSQGGIDVIYEFTPSLELVRATFSSRYWEMHRSLEIQGKLRHSQEACPDRNGPRAIQVWEPETGWRSQPIAR